MTAVPEIARNTWLKRCERPVARVTRIFQTNGTARDARKIIRMFHRCGDLCETLNSPLFPTACTETNSSMERSPLVWHLVTASFASPGFPSVRSSVTRLLLLIDSIAIELTVLLTVSCWFTSGCLHTKLEQKRFRRSAICFSTPFRIGQPFLATIRQKPSSTIHLHTRVPIEFLIDSESIRFPLRSVLLVFFHRHHYGRWLGISSIFHTGTIFAADSAFAASFTVVFVFARSCSRCAVPCTGERIRRSLNPCGHE